MNYTYDRRPGKTAASDQDDEDEKEAKRQRLQDLIGLVDDAVQPANRLLDALDKRTDTDLSDARDRAQAVRDDVSIAEDVEKLEDFIANIQAARKGIGPLETALKDAKKEAKSEKDTDALEAIEDAFDELRELKRELKDIEDEMEE